MPASPANTISMPTSPAPGAEFGALYDPAVDSMAASLDDLEKTWVAAGNRLRQMTRVGFDKDGKLRGFGLHPSHPNVVTQQAIVDGMAELLQTAEKHLKSAVAPHPLYPWAKSVRGVGDKQFARLLGAVGDPYIRPSQTREDGTVVPTGPRTVSALWRYCGLDPVVGEDGTSAIRRRAKGQKAAWNHKAKMRVHLIAASCLKQLVKPCAVLDEGDDESPRVVEHVDGCKCSPYRVVYDKRRAHTATTHPEWPPIRSHNDGLTVAKKEILKDLWCAARDFHAQAN
jgi:hypothetical protein